MIICARKEIRGSVGTWVWRHVYTFFANAFETIIVTPPRSLVFFEAGGIEKVPHAISSTVRQSRFPVPQSRRRIEHFYSFLALISGGNDA